MASELPAVAGSPPSAQVVGIAFVHQYYNILYQSPGLVYRFYQEISKLGRPDAQGSMISITTLGEINEKIMSTDYGGLRAEIKTVDAQDSLNGGVLVLVTGYLTGKNNVRRNFTQSFFLATQDKGYFVLNDMLRYVNEAEQQRNEGLANGTAPSLSPGHEAPPPRAPPQEKHVQEQFESPPEEENVIEEVYNPSEHEECPVVEEETPYGEVFDEVPNSSQATTTDSGSNAYQEEAPKKSYASIVKVMKENVAPSLVPTTALVKAVPSKPDRQPGPAPMPSSAPEIPAVSSNAPETSSIQESEVDGHSIYVKGLPLNATSAQLEEEFKRFGSIKLGGIQVRSHKLHGFCFGFIEFETAASVQSAIEASPVMIDGCQVSVEEKRPTGSRVSSRGRFSGRMGGFRGEGGRGRGNFGGGRGYGRGDFSGRTDFGGRGSGRGGSGRGDGVYQRVDHMGPTGGHGSRSGSATTGFAKNVTPRVSAPAQQHEMEKELSGELTRL